jgi:hypothetical protein
VLTKTNYPRKVVNNVNNKVFIAEKEFSNLVKLLTKVKIDRPFWKIFSPRYTTSAYWIDKALCSEIPKKPKVGDYAIKAVFCDLDGEYSYELERYSSFFTSDGPSVYGWKFLTRTKDTELASRWAKHYQIELPILPEI